MRIVIDLQAAQAANRFRGIGRYAMSLALAMVRNRGQHEVLIALNGRFPESVAAIRAAFHGLLPKDNIRLWMGLSNVSGLSRDNDSSRHATELIREAFLASLRPDIIHVMSHFEGHSDDAVTSIRSMPGSILTSVTIYDQAEFTDPANSCWHLEKVEQLRLADLWLAISESSRREGIEGLELPSERSINISPDDGAHFTPAETEDGARLEIIRRCGLSRPFVMYAGGLDCRKDIEALIRAFAAIRDSLRKHFQLAILCDIGPEGRLALEQLAAGHGLGGDDLVFIHFFPEDILLALYNSCALAVFPSLLEAFGPSAMEAVRRTAPTIGANASSWRGVIGLRDAIFDLHTDSAIAACIEQALAETDFRQESARSVKGQPKLFSWNESARRAIAAMEGLVNARSATPPAPLCPDRRPRLAYVSPLPPSRSGIAEYSRELLPELARYYAIDVVVAEEGVEDQWILQNCAVLSVEGFRLNATSYDRVIYHFGNSAYHEHMFSLLGEIPGVVVLHDFFLADIVHHIERRLGHDEWMRALYASHGYQAQHIGFAASDPAEAVWKYPCNLPVLQGAQGVIVHSDYSLRLAQQWYGATAGKGWRVIPLERRKAEVVAETRQLARARLGVRADQFMVCSFGIMGPTKQNHRLLEAWMRSSLAWDERCHLVFVGEGAIGDYGSDLRQAIAQSGCGARIKITGWADAAMFRNYLEAADIGVQLCALSRGETSGTVLDCMNHGLATIVNSNGSMAELPEDGVWKLPDDFEDEHLAEALTLLYSESERRKELGARAQEIIRSRHDPAVCAARYADALECFHREASASVPALVREIAGLSSPTPDDKQLAAIAAAIDYSIPPPVSPPQLFVDVSDLVREDHRTGIQRLVRAILREMLLNPPAGFRVEPVYVEPGISGFRYARQFTQGFLGLPDCALLDEPISYRSGDYFLGLDLNFAPSMMQGPFLQEMRQAGVSTYFVVYDLLPVRRPQSFPPGAEEPFARWLDVVAQGDGAICISRATADDLSGWLAVSGPSRRDPFAIRWFSLGSDVENSSPTSGVPADASLVLGQCLQRPTFLIVATVEPRKGHSQVLGALDQLWGSGVDVNLVIVGKQGWMVEALAEQLRQHPELTRRLFWLEGISDEYLEKIYAAASCLIVASLADGHCLPMIEAARHGLPIIARDIPVFREIAGEHAQFFQGEAPRDLASALAAWLEKYRHGQHVSSAGIPRLTWRQSAESLKRALFS